MSGVRKLRILSWSVIFNGLLVSCSGDAGSEMSRLEIQGEAQGTTYSIILTDPDAQVSGEEIDSIFTEIDQALSTYKQSSVISRINAVPDSVTLEDPHGLFKRCYELSQRIYRISGGHFDPSVYPLMNGWGFLSDTHQPLDSAQVDSVLQYVSFGKGRLHEVAFEGKNVVFQKRTPHFKLDFNAIAQGLSVDVIDEFLKEKGYRNYYIEVGGEIVTRGKNAEGEKWRIGVDTPVKNATTRELENIIHVSGKGIATSGNYRHFYTYKGVDYGHTLDPITGFPVQHDLLSVTVIAPNAALADAYATLFMVLGKEEAMKFIREHPEEHLEAYFLYADGDEIARLMTDGFSAFLKP